MALTARTTGFDSSAGHPARAAARRRAAILSCLVAMMTSCGAGGGNGSEGGIAVDGNYMGESLSSEDGRPQDRVYCEVVEKQTPREDCEVLSEAAQITWGSAAFTVPDPMQVGDKAAVKLIIDRRAPVVVDLLDSTVDMSGTPTASNGQAELGEAGNTAEPLPDDPPLPSPGEEPLPPGVEPALTPKQVASKLEGTTAESFDLPVGRRMRSDLRGQGFSVQPISPVVQEIDRGGQAIWTWEVVAEQGGPKSLTVSTVVQAEVNGRVYELKPTSYERTLTVGVPWYVRVRQVLEAMPGWLKLVTAVLTALTAMLTAWWALRAVLRGRRPAEGGTPQSP